MFDFKRLFIAMLVIIIVQYIAGWILAMAGIYGIVASVIIDFVVAFALVYIYTPKNIRKYALKTTQFHYNVLIYFAILFVFTLIQYI